MMFLVLPTLTGEKTCFQDDRPSSAAAFAPNIPSTSVALKLIPPGAFSGRLREGVKMSVTYTNRRIRTLEDARAWHQVIVNNALDDPWEVKYYVGWRNKLRNLRKRLHI